MEIMETITMPRKSFGGSRQATEENMEYCLEQFKKLYTDEKKYTFRQWLNKMMTLLDLID
jgi:hypothetical protein